MANDATIRGEEFYKSLAKLEALAGVNQQEENKDLQKSQICTGPNSEKKEWAGSKWEDVPGNGPGADKIKEDGTDYNERGVRKSIMEKVEKGIPLTASELSLLKGDLDKADPNFMKKADEKEEKDKDKEKYEFEVSKSMDSAVQENETLKKGIEVSEFLSELTKAFGAGLQGLEARMDAKIDHIYGGLNEVLSQFAGEQGDFNKSLAEAVVNIGHGVGNAISTAEEASHTPVGAPKSHLQVVQGGNGHLEKSFQGPPGGSQINKSMMLGAMTDLVEKGQLNSLEVIKFDSTGDINPATEQRVIQHIQNGNR